MNAAPDITFAEPDDTVLAPALHEFVQAAIVHDASSRRSSAGRTSKLENISLQLDGDTIDATKGLAASTGMGWTTVLRSLIQPLVRAVANADPGWIDRLLWAIHEANGQRIVQECTSENPDLRDIGHAAQLVGMPVAEYVISRAVAVARWEIGTVQAVINASTGKGP